MKKWIKCILSLGSLIGSILCFITLFCNRSLPDYARFFGFISTIAFYLLSYAWMEEV